MGSLWGVGQFVKIFEMAGRVMILDIPMENENIAYYISNVFITCYELFKGRLLTGYFSGKSGAPRWS